MSDAAPPRPNPVSIEAEQALLGALLIHNEVADSIAGLDADHFYDPVHARIYALAMSLIAESKVASPVSLRMRMADDEGLKDIGGGGYLTRLVEAAISVVAAPSYAEDIIDLARRRAAIEAMTEAQDRLAAMEDVGETLGGMEAALDTSRGESAQESGVSVRAALGAAAGDINAAYQGGEPVGMSFGIPALDSVMGRAQGGEYILCGARPSMGKSALAIEVARRVAGRGVAVVYWCAEMAPRENGHRMLSAAARDRGVRVPYRDALDGTISEDQFRTLLEAGRGMEHLPIHFVEPSIADVRRLGHEIRRHVRRYQRQGREVLVVIDYLQKIVAEGRNGNERVGQASAAMKRLAMQLRVPFFVLAQLNRSVESRENKRPMLSDLRDSGEIEQDGNTIFFLYRDEYYLERAVLADPDGPLADATRQALSRARGRLDIIGAKVRSGPIKSVTVGYEAATNSFYEWGDVVPFPGRDQEDIGA